jgi:signal transduction histidine kinase
VEEAIEMSSQNKVSDMGRLLSNPSGLTSSSSDLSGEGDACYRGVYNLLRYASGLLPQMGALDPLIRKTEEMFGLFGVKALCLSVDGEKLEYLPHWHFDEIPEDVGTGIYIPVQGSVGGLAVESGKTVHVYDVLTNDRWIETHWSIDSVIGSFLVTPIFLNDSLWGVYCGFTETPRSFSEEEIASFEMIAHLIGVVIDRVSTKNKMDHLFLNLATISHDARNALLPISFAVRAMEKKYGESIPEKALEYLDVITAAGTKTGDILRSWRRGAEEIPSDYASCNLMEGLVSGMAMFRIQAEARNIDLKLDIPDSETDAWIDETCVKISSADMDRVIQGYISNAIKYCRRTVRVEVINDEEKGEAGFRVNDDGDGIDPEFRERVFDSFYQLPNSHPGEGLGLAGVRFTVERNGGRFGVDQSSEGGASFWALFSKSF